MLSPTVWIGGWGEEVMLIILEAVFVFEVLAFCISMACSAHDRSLKGWEFIAMWEMGYEYVFQLLVVGSVVGF